MKYRITFCGRLKGAIGVFESFDVTVDAANADEALLGLYATHEHIRLNSVVVEKAPRNNCDHCDEPVVWAATQEAWINADPTNAAPCSATGGHFVSDDVTISKKAPRSYTFGDWMTAVNNEVQAIIGLGIADLEDHPFRDWFTDEMPPAEAAHIAIEYAGGGDLL